jgi:predicted 2-oxoglutarate/Fe(II)-dependent dioxygenase YbiX
MGPPELGLPVAHGVVIYVNENYSGGELYYAKLGLEIKPKRGMLVIHSAASMYEHGVREVTAGVRYGLTLFVNDPAKMTKN